MRALLMVLFLCIYFFASAGNRTAVIRGKIFDNENNESLIGANIIYGNNQGTISDNNGNYNLIISSGKWKITFLYVGYKTETRTVNLESGDTLLLNMGLFATVNEIDNIVVSANKVEQKLSDLTVSMTLIKPYYLSNNHLTNAEELLNKTPGIEVLDGQASIRGGSGFSYGAGSRVMALIDGLPIISPDAGNIKWQFLPLDNLSQVEIIKGASSVMYGSSALNGVINFRTAEAETEPRTKFFVETGIFDHPSRKEWKWWDTPRISTNASLSHLQKFGNTNFGISGSALFDNGYRKFNDEKLGRFNIHLKHKSAKDERLSYGINLNSGLNQTIGFVLWENATNGALMQSESTVTELNGSFFAIDPFVSYRQNDHTSHDLRMRVQSNSNKYPDGDQTNSHATSYYTEYQYQHHLSKSIFINLGASENSSKVVSNFYGNHQITNIAGYSQVDIETVKRLKIVAGIRIEQNIQDGKADQLVPIFRTGINYQLADFSFLRASFGQGYRYPSIAEKYASTSLGAVKIYPSPYIRPESGWNSEVALKHGLAFGNITGMVDLAAFYAQNSDMIEYVFGLYQDRTTAAYDFGFQAVNIENSRVYGTELEFRLNHSNSLFNQSLSGGYLFMYPAEYNSITKQNTGNFLKYRRMHTASLEWNIRMRRFDIGWNCYAKSKMLEIDNVFVNEFTREDILPGFYQYWINHNKGYLLTDVNFGFRKSEKIKLSFAVKNLFNIEYMGRPGDIMPHRNYSVRLSFFY